MKTKEVKDLGVTRRRRAGFSNSNLIFRRDHRKWKFLEGGTKLRRLSIIYVGSKTKSGLPLVVLYNFRYRHVDYRSEFRNLVNFPSYGFKLLHFPRRRTRSCIFIHLHLQFTPFTSLNTALTKGSQ